MKEFGREFGLQGGPFPSGDRDSTMRARDAIFNPSPAVARSDDAQSCLASSEASWAALFGLVSPRLVHAVGHGGGRRTLSPFSINANPFASS